MAFEMSLPHPPRIQLLAADGGETVALDERQWHLYFTVQQALQQQQEADGTEGEAGEEKGERPKEAAPQPSDPQKALEKLLNARGELDVITDLITFVEQQQFLAVEGIHRHPASLEERVRTRSLRLATAKRQLSGAAAALESGLAALRARAQVDDRFLADLAQLRQRWKLRRHGGTAGLFYADISLPLRSCEAQGVSQEGAQVNLLQDTNGDACIVESVAGGKRRAVRGWRHIHAVLEARQRQLAWRVVQQMVAAQARHARHEADVDRAVAAVQRMVAAAVAASQAAVHSAVASGGAGAGVGPAEGAVGMEVDGQPGDSSDAGSKRQGAPTAAAAVQAAGQPYSVLHDSMMSSAAKDIQAALSSPGFQQRFESRSLLLLSRLLVRGGGAKAAAAAAAAAGGGASPAAQQQQQEQQEQQEQHGAILDSLLQWLRHAALRLRVAASLQRWRAAAPGRQLRQVESGEEFTAVWQLTGAAGAADAAALPLLAVVQGSKVRMEGGSRELAAMQPATAARLGLSGPDLDRLLLSL